MNVTYDVLQVLDRDMKFLSDHSVMDYSVLIAIEIDYHNISYDTSNETLDHRRSKLHSSFGSSLKNAYSKMSHDVINLSSTTTSDGYLMWYPCRYCVSYRYIAIDDILT